MTKDEIIRMAEEAGFKRETTLTYGHPYTAYKANIERFAALVAAHAKQEYIDSVYEQHRETMFSNKDLGMLVDAVKAEREACAKVCDDMAKCCFEMNPSKRVVESIAAVIRARGEK